jgi:drug/metabolite transporter (DMT)-like permease
MQNNKIKKPLLSTAETEDFEKFDNLQNITSNYEINKEKNFTPTPTNHSQHSENFSLFLFACSVACYGMSNFQLKYIQIAYGSEYDVFSFALWRNLSLTAIIYSIIRYKEIEIIPLERIQNKFWFSVRTMGQYASLCFFMLSLQNLRVGTANCFVSMNPAAVVIISTLLLKEKFHIRYVIGICVCFTGVLLIISNESKNHNTKNLKDEVLELPSDTFGVIFSAFWGTVNLITIGCMSVASKFLHKENFGHENQCFYIGVTNFLASVVICLIQGNLHANLGFIFASMLNSIFFLIATFLNILAVKGVDLNKTTPLNYISIVVSTFLSVIVLSEPLFFTDFLGSFVILGYNVYNSMNPIK